MQFLGICLTLISRGSSRSATYAGDFEFIGGLMPLSRPRHKNVGSFHALFGSHFIHLSSFRDRSTSFSSVLGSARRF